MFLISHRRLHAWFFLLIVLLLTPRSTAAQSTTIHRKILETYNFQPHALTSQQITQKSAVLDQFWAAAKADSSVYIPALRQELADFKNPRFFLYDGSALLLSLSDTPADRKIALAAMSQCDLRDVQAKDYFHQVHRMATLGADTTAAAFHILEQPKFHVIVPQHAMTLGQNYALIYMLLPTEQAFWLQPAITRVEIEPDDTAQKSLILLLWYAQTDAADKAIAAFAAETSRPASVREFARQIMERNKHIEVKERAEAVVTNEASVREKRRERMKAVSDEALIDLDEYTMTLAALRK